MDFRGSALAFFVVVTSGLGFVGCEKEQVDVNVDVKVVNNDSQPVVDAQVKADGKVLGVTDEKGHWQGELKAPASISKRFEITKESEQYYFAPHYETVQLVRSGRQTIKINAKLYYVAKPDFNTEVSEKTGSKLKSGEDDGDFDNSEEVEAAPEPEPEPAPEKTPSKVAELPASLPEKVKTSEEKQDLPEAIEEPAKIALKAKAPVELAKELPPPKVALAKVDQQPAQKTPLPFTKHKQNGRTVFTVHVYSHNKPIKSAQVYVGKDENRDLKLACATNARGRCVVRFKEKPKKPVAFVVKKSGYQTTTRSIRVVANGRLKVNLRRGESIDIFALQKSYNFTSGLKDISVIVDGRQVGKTDKFGHFSHVYTGKKDDLMEVILKSNAYLPENFQTDFVVSGPMTLVRYFTPSSPPAVKMSLLEPQVAGSLKTSYDKDKALTFDRFLKASARTQIFSLSAFKDYSNDLLKRDLKIYDLSMAKIMRSGWQKTDLKSKVDALIVPTVVFENPPSIELSVVDSRGQVIAAAKEQLESISDKVALDQALKAISRKIAAVFPFEGSVLSDSGNQVTINLGFKSGTGIKIGDRVAVYGTQTDPTGNEKSQKKIATLQVLEVQDAISITKILNQQSRSKINRGDLVVLERKLPTKRLAKSSQVPYLKIISQENGSFKKPLAQANVYFDNVWLGATGLTGRLYLTKDLPRKRGILKVIRHGYSPYKKEVNLSQVRQRLDIALRQVNAFVRIESKPSGATVKIDGKQIGQTPISYPIPVPSGFVKLELSGVSGYKKYAQVLELDEGTLDLTGSRSIPLEVDYLVISDRFLKAGKPQQALAKLNDIPESHSDYLIAHHMAGEIYLSQLGQPENSMRSFLKVTKSPQVANFNDKRFIGSHINLGIAYFVAAEKASTSNLSLSADYYLKAIETLEKVEPFLRFVKKEQYPEAVHNVKFHKALSKHKLWMASKDPNEVRLVFKAWREYLDGSARTVPLNEDNKGFVEYAKVYLKQAQATLKSKNQL